MNNIIKRVWNQNRMVNIEDLTGAAFQAEDGGHTFQISGIDDTGAAVSLSGTVAGVFRRPDNADIALTGAASDGKVSVTLTEDCYAVRGRFGLTIFVTADSQKTAVYAAIGTVASTNGGAVAGDTPQDVVDLINAISAAVATIPASYSSLMADISPTYSSSSVYPVGAYVYYNGDLYRCTTPITTPETWTAAHWTAAVLGNDVCKLKSALQTANAFIIPNQTNNSGVVTWTGEHTAIVSGTVSTEYDIILEYTYNGAFHDGTKLSDLGSFVVNYNAYGSIDTTKCKVVYTVKTVSNTNWHGTTYIQKPTTIIIPSDVTDYRFTLRVSPATFNGNISITLQSKYDNFTEHSEKDIIDLIYSRHDIIDAGSYEHGSITNGANDTFRQAARARSKTICEHDYDVEISTDVGQYIVSYYDEEDTFKFATAWKTKVPYIIPAGMRYRLLLTLDNTSTASVEVTDILAEFTIAEKKDRFSKEIQLLQPLKYHFNTNPSTIGTWANQNNSNLLTIAHISDVHSDWIRYKNFYNFFKSNPSLIDAAIQTGDLIDAPTDKQINVMHGIDPNNNVIWCTGNHEMAGIENNVTYTSTLSNLYSKFGLSTNTGKLYHYVDFASKGIRLIVLNDYNTDNTSHDQDYGATQLDWFVNALKDAASNNLAVIVAMHTPESSIDSNNKGFYMRFDQWSTLILLNIYTAVEDIIDAFVNGTSVTTTYYNNQTYSADFTGVSGNFVCYMTGHRHQDSNGYSHNHPSQLYLNITCGALRNWLATPSENPSSYTAPSDLPRIEGTDCENAFNVYTFDLKNRIVKVLRVGANMNDLTEPRVSAYYSF